MTECADGSAVLVLGQGLIDHKGLMSISLSEQLLVGNVFQIFGKCLNTPRHCARAKVIYFLAIFFGVRGASDFSEKKRLAILVFK